MNFKMVDFFDSTYLKTKEQANITSEEDKQCVEAVVLEAIEHQFKLVMIRSSHIAFAKEIIAENKSNVLVGTVIDFPNGISSTESKLDEIQLAINLGADDIDVVINYNRFIQSDKDYIANEIKECTALCLSNNKTIKWIIESAALSDNEIIGICQIIRGVVLENFDKTKSLDVFVKSSTGFYISPNSEPNGATVSAIKLMIQHSSPLPVKASGGIRSAEDFNTMINLGVKRIGTSSALAILQGKHSNSNY
jgi:deoxyribose-phosphate aldolase